MPHEATAWSLTVFGPSWWVFWFAQIGLGFPMPVPLVSLPSTRSTGTFPLGAAGLFMVMGVFGARLNLLIPATIQPAFDALPGAYHLVRWALGYAPNAVEWGVLAGRFALGAWLFLAARKFLPLTRVAAPGYTPMPRWPLMHTSRMSASRISLAAACRFATRRCDCSGRHDHRLARGFAGRPATRMKGGRR
ncbi:MAG: hypothetical protein KatS3mg077_0546 [Candidatus Binatia bacterium]|nr:MAG: hypothetical protein KatS3mg077_0546 [Candidatus Binatia bacterium]